MEKDQAQLPRPYKQCPDCLEKLPLDARRCTQCGSRVGKALADGKARKPIDWKNYILSAILIAAFIYYMRWAFFSE
jgi:predicted amidophosphoribosyltransferase